MLKRPVSTEFAPTMQTDDLRVVRNLLTNKIDPDEQGRAFDRLRKWFSQYTSHKYVFFFASGRAALYYALKSLPTDSQKKEVVTQSLTCVAVPNAISWAKYKPIYTDIDLLTYNMDISSLKENLSHNTRAVITQHTFGIPSHVKAIKKSTNNKDIYLIEDCAHSLGAKYEEKPVGSYGDVSIFSFGRDKVVSSIFGGVATTNDPALAKKLREYEASLSTPPRSFVIKQLLYPLFYKVSLPFYSIRIGKAIIRVMAMIKLITPALTAHEKKGGIPFFLSYKFSSKLAHLALHQLQKLHTLNTHRKKMAQTYCRLLHKKFLKDGVYVRFPVTVKNPSLVIRKAKKHGFYLGNWYSNPVYPLNNNPNICYTQGKTPRAEKVAKHIINLPTGPHTTISDAHTIAKLIKPFLYEN